MSAEDFLVEFDEYRRKHPHADNDSGKLSEYLGNKLTVLLGRDRQDSILLASTRAEVKRDEDQLRELYLENEELKSKIERLEKENGRLKEDLIHDPLTGLKTKNFLSDSVREALATMASPEQEKRRNPHENISLVFCDIDNFKKLNDTYGHAFGDTVLKAVAKVLNDNVRDTDIAARYGGEEMVIGLLGANSREAFGKAEEIREKVEALRFTEQPGLVVTLSLGVSSSLPGQNLDVETLIKQADEAMYVAKNSGKNTVRVFAQ